MEVQWWTRLWKIYTDSQLNLNVEQSCSKFLNGSFVDFVIDVHSVVVKAEVLIVSLLGAIGDHKGILYGFNDGN